VEGLDVYLKFSACWPGFEKTCKTLSSVGRLRPYDHAGAAISCLKHNLTHDVYDFDVVAPGNLL
jgi:hypothetical protein